MEGLSVIKRKEEGARSDSVGEGRVPIPRGDSECGRLCCRAARSCCRTRRLVILKVDKEVQPLCWVTRREREGRLKIA